jgi:C-terminal processing protease CtpA/Prc
MFELTLFSQSGDTDGVGIVLEFGTGTEHFPVVQNLIPGKAAYACGKITIGDLLVRIGSHPTEYASFNQVRDLIVGPIGSRVTLSFRGASGEYQCENLVRGPVEMNYLTLVSSSAACARSESRPAPVDDSAPVKSDILHRPAAQTALI